MSNSYFKFKAFTIHQEIAGMKVSTDACFFGAYIQLADQSLELLDVGTGTGLLSLMLAQRYPSSAITALEIDDSAYQQAINNVGSSPFSEQITVKHQNFFDYTGKTYDVIISNPPYFHQQLTANNKQRQLARHSQNQPLEWLNKMHQLLKPDGQIWLLLHEKDIHLWQHWENQFLHTIAIRTHAHKPTNRYILHWDFSQKIKTHQSIAIYDALHNLTDLAQRILKPYYLNL